jgi:hypothetical protein
MSALAESREKPEQFELPFDLEALAASGLETELKVTRLPDGSARVTPRVVKRETARERTVSIETARRRLGYENRSSVYYLIQVGILDAYQPRKGCKYRVLEESVRKAEGRRV